MNEPELLTADVAHGLLQYTGLHGYERRSLQSLARGDTVCVRWVKCSERMPSSDGQYVCSSCNNTFIRIIGLSGYADADRAKTAAWDITHWLEGLTSPMEPNNG